MQMDADIVVPTDNNIGPNVNQVEINQSTSSKSAPSKARTKKKTPNVNDKTATNNPGASADDVILIDDEPLNLTVTNRSSTKPKNNDEPLDLSMKHNN